MICLFKSIFPNWYLFFIILSQSMLEDFYSDSDEEEKYQSLLEESNMSIRRFLKKMKDDINGEELVLAILFF